MTDLTITDRNGSIHVFLSPDGDHIVTKLHEDARGREVDLMLAHGSWAWSRAVERAQRGAAFL